MSELCSAWYEIGFDTRPLTLVMDGNEQTGALLGETSLIIRGMQDFVADDDAKRLQAIWIKSVTERKPTLLLDATPANNAEEEVLRLAALAADKIDLTMEVERIKGRDLKIPERYAVNLPDTDMILRQEALETLVPFQRVRELLLQREKENTTEPIGHISIFAKRIDMGTGPRGMH